MGFESHRKKSLALTACERRCRDFREAGGCIHFIPRRERLMRSGEQYNCETLPTGVSLNQRVILLVASKLLYPKKMQDRSTEHD